MLSFHQGRRPSLFPDKSPTQQHWQTSLLCSATLPRASNSQSVLWIWFWTLSLIYWISGYWIWILDSFDTERYSCQHFQVSGPWDSPRFFFLGVHLVGHLCKNEGRSWTTLRTDCHVYLNTKLMISPKRPAFFNGLSTTSQRSRKAQALPSSPTLKKTGQVKLSAFPADCLHSLKGFSTHRSPISSNLLIRSPLDVEKDRDPGVGIW